MSLSFKCEHCGKKLKAGADQAGARFKCTGCGEVGRVPRWDGEVKKPAVSLFDAGGHEEPPVKFSSAADSENELDMTPMVDVTFLLLIFFMITAAFSMQKSIEVPPPELSEAVSQNRTIEEYEEDDEFIIVFVDEDSVIWVNDHEAPTRHELRARLREELDAPDPPSSLLVRAHGDCDGAAVVMCMDVGNALGIENVRLASGGEE